MAKKKEIKKELKNLLTEGKLSNEEIIDSMIDRYPSDKKIIKKYMKDPEFLDSIEKKDQTEDNQLLKLVDTISEGEEVTETERPMKKVIRDLDKLVDDMNNKIIDIDFGVSLSDTDDEHRLEQLVDALNDLDDESSDDASDIPFMFKDQLSRLREINKMVLGN